MPIREEDVPLINHVRKSFLKWLAQDGANRESFLNIPDTSEGAIADTTIPAILNRYQIRLVHQIVRREFPGFKTAGKGNFIQITPFENKREIEEKAQQARYRERDISRATEFRWLIEAMVGGNITGMPPGYFIAAFPSEVKPEEGEADGVLRQFIDDLQTKLETRRRIIFGHNCFTDLVYLYRCFIGDLPEKVEDFQRLVRELFPAVVDTKHMASFGRGWHSSSLQDVEEELRTEKLPQIEIPAEFDRYVDGRSFHEAGFDSLLTAKIGIKLSAKLEREDKYPRQKGDLVEVVNGAEDDDEQSEHYTTATESIADNESIISNITSTVEGALSLPAAAINSITRDCDTNLASTGQQFESDEPVNKEIGLLPITSTAGELGGLQSAKAIGVEEKAVNCSKTDEVEKVRAALTHSHIDNVMSMSTQESGDYPPIHPEAYLDNSEQRLPGSGAKQLDDDQFSDLLVFSDKTEDEVDDEQAKPADLSEATKSPLTQLQLLRMVEKGGLMPRWDGGFWKFFGKRLQVNSSVEGFCEV